MSQINSNKKHYWKRVKKVSDQKKETLIKDFQGEFEKEANQLTDLIDRRNFFKIMGASISLAGLAGCKIIRRPKGHLVPYNQDPEHLVPGNSLLYATSYALGDEVGGLLVESYEGRPTKIEGNPLYNDNKGTSSVFHQASILDLYDPDRVKNYLKAGQKLNKKDFEIFLTNIEKQLKNTKGKGFGILAERIPSSTQYRLLNTLKTKFPSLEIALYNPINFDNIYNGLNEVTGKACLPKIDFKKANVVVSFDSDFLSEKEPFWMENTRSYSQRRDPDDTKGLNRLYQFESFFSITGGKADHRFKVKSRFMEYLIYKLILNLNNQGLTKINYDIIVKIKAHLLNLETHFSHLKAYKALTYIAKDLLNHKGNCVIVAGSKQPPLIHALVYFINQWLENNNKTVSYYRNPFDNKSLVAGSNLSTLKSLDRSLRKDNYNSFKGLNQQIKKGKVKKLIILGGDPLYYFEGDLNFQKRFKKIETIHLSSHLNKTAKNASFVIPRSHYLESWSDLTSLQGVSGIVQPLIMPLYESFSDIELLSYLIGEKKESRSLVKNTWRFLDNAKWRESIHNGFINKRSFKINNIYGILENLARPIEIQKKGLKNNLNTLEVVFHCDSKMYDGRFINNGWLQEMPDPITKICWDNAIIVSQKTAKKYKIDNEDIVKIKLNNKTIEGAIFIQPGQADDSISLFLGYGQSENQGRIASNSGYNAYLIKPASEEKIVLKGTIIKTKKKYSLASVQEHWNINKPNGSSQNGRPLILEADIETYKKNPTFAKDRVKVSSLDKFHERQKDIKNPHPMSGDQMSIFPQRNYEEGYQWGMSIDLSKCTGCNACMIACQAENNIPIVGKKMVLKGREMHWIRLDRYFGGDDEEATMSFQPMTCLHCETAPCEQVCPVAATVHSEEGTNDMAYNRCIGTRFCSNNCPVKVRRFNFLDYHQTNPQSKKKIRKHLFDLIREPEETMQMQFNPNVTVRMRGVMEKCTYCIQRVSKAKINAKNEKRLLVDGEIKTACEQTCPAGVITFGNINDKKSRVSHLKEKDRDYHLLAELNLKPRTTYLASIKNFNKELKNALS